MGLILVARFARPFQLTLLKFSNIHIHTECSFISIDIWSNAFYTSILASAKLKKEKWIRWTEAEVNQLNRSWSFVMGLHFQLRKPTFWLQFWPLYSCVGIRSLLLQTCRWGKKVLMLMLIVTTMFAWQPICKMSKHWAHFTPFFISQHYFWNMSMTRADTAQLAGSYLELWNFP